MVDVRCPRCGAIFPYSQIAKQLIKKRFDPDAILKIIKDSGEVGITTGQLFEKYRVNSQPPFMSLRHLNSIVKELEKDGKVTTKRLCMGSRGRTSSSKSKLIITSPTSPTLMLTTFDQQTFRSFPLHDLLHNLKLVPSARLKH